MKQERLLIELRKSKDSTSDEGSLGEGNTDKESTKSKRTFDEVSIKLKKLIFDGILQPGQQLPSEHALAQLFQVGRQSIREALRVLEISGFLTIKAGVKGGPVVENTLHSKIATLFVDAFKYNKVSLDDLISARRAIQISMLDFVFKNADKEDIECLRNNVSNAKAKLAKKKNAFEENIEFHRLLARASKNYVFSIVMESILTVLSDLRSKLTAVGRIELSRDITETHEELLDAIEKRKKRKAVAMIDQNMDYLKDILKSNFK